MNTLVQELFKDLNGTVPSAYRIIRKKVHGTVDISADIEAGVTISIATQRLPVWHYRFPLYNVALLTADKLAFTVLYEFKRFVISQFVED